MEKTSKIYVAGHTGMVGSAIVRELQKQGLFTDLNPEICPDELFYEMTNKKKGG